MDMNKYLVPIRINGQIIKTVIFANSVIHARLIGEWQFGIGNVVSTPTAISEEATQKPLTPPQARVKALQSQADRALQRRRPRTDSWSQRHQALSTLTCHIEPNKFGLNLGCDFTQTMGGGTKRLLL